MILGNYGRFLGEMIKINEVFQRNSLLEYRFTYNFADYVKRIPFVGDAIFEALGVDEIRTKMKKEFVGAIYDTAQAGQISMGGLSRMISATFGGMAKIVTGTLKTIFLNLFKKNIVALSPCSFS